MKQLNPIILISKPNTWVSHLIELRSGMEQSNMIWAYVGNGVGNKWACINIIKDILWKG
jgi:hypothetical protein